MAPPSRAEQFEVLDADLHIEEETIARYRAEKFYPVKFGDTYHNRYTVIMKLGFGTNSTIWLCRDYSTSEYVAVKICTTATDESRTSTELATLKHLMAARDQYNAKRLVRLPLDDFTLHSDQGEHQCMVFEPCGMSYTDFRNLSPEKVLPKDNVQMTLQVLLVTLAFVHEAGVIHTDLSPNNLLLGVHDSAVFDKMVEQMQRYPAPRKILKDRVIYGTLQMPLTYALPVVCDFGSAKIGTRFSDDVMPSVYRAPEIILGMEWDCKIDVWSVGMMVWDLFQGHRLFRVVKDGMINDDLHLAEMMSLMGPPPKSFLARSEKCREYWDAEGNWIAATPIPEQTLESLEGRLHGADQANFLRFLRRILCWDPDERASATELADDNWLVHR